MEYGKTNDYKWHYMPTSLLPLAPQLFQMFSWQKMRNGLTLRIYEEDINWITIRGKKCIRRITITFFRQVLNVSSDYLDMKRKWWVIASALSNTQYFISVSPLRITMPLVVFKRNWLENSIEVWDRLSVAENHILYGVIMSCKQNEK